MRPLLLAGSALLALALQSVPAAADIPGHVIAEVRARNEFVDQQGFTRSADALTVRARIGYETPAFNGFKALVEAEGVGVLSGGYNSTVNGRTSYPQIPDPNLLELNRAQVTWSGPQAEVTVGRQRIVLNNARFIGNSGFRQNEQTFDAARLVVRPAANLSLTYIYIDNVHRIFGPEHPLGRFSSDSHVLQVDWRVSTAAQLSAYAYLLDFRNAPSLSSATYGARLTGALPLNGPLQLTYEAEYARQSDYADNPASISLDYVAASLGLRRRTTSAALGYERLDGDGVNAFQTPLATLHAFQGWADAFLTTPARGVRDLNLRLATTWVLPPRLPPLRLQLAGHDFAPAHGGGRYGRELDASASWPLTSHITTEIAAARFEGSQAGFADRTKVWVTLEVKY